jgi:competence protein ComEC
MVSRTPGLNKNRGLIFRRLAFWLKDKMENIIFKRVSPLAASVLDAMILGEKRNIPALIYNSMIKSGTVHILVVSGFNVGIVSFIIILFLKLIRLARPLRIYAAIPLLILYCLVTGASNPVVRATVMAIVFMFAYFVRREPDIYNSCAVAMIFILVLNPRQLSDIGFQLSFASVISIVYLYPKIKSLLRIELLKTKYLKFLCDGCLVSFSAWLGTMGFIAYYFKVFSPITVLANIFIVPLATLITLCGLCLIVIELICPVLAPFFAYTNELSVLLLLKINAFFIKLPAAYFYLPR